jgi:plastocyanin
MNKNFPIIVLILLVVALSGCTGSETSKTTSVEVQRFDRADQNLDAKIVDVKLEPDDVRAGEKVIANLFIANIGSEKITNETVEIKAKVKTLDDSLANIYLKTMSDEKKTWTMPFEFETEIEPGTVKTVSTVFNTIKEMDGRSLAGTYEITITLSANGQKIESRILPITLKSGTLREFTPIPTPTPLFTPTPTFTPTLTPAPTPALTPTQTPTIIVPTPEITEIANPTPTPETTPFVAATPTGKNVTVIVKADMYTPSDITIGAGDMVIWINKELDDYTLVEMDNKIPDIVLRARNNYTFSTTGNYRIALKYRNMRVEPKILTVNVK